MQAGQVPARMAALDMSLLEPLSGRPRLEEVQVERCGASLGLLPRFSATLLWLVLSNLTYPGSLELCKTLASLSHLKVPPPPPPPPGECGCPPTWSLRRSP